MPRPNSCCNPLGKDKHCRVFKNVKLVNDNWSSVFRNLTGKYICDSCRRAILKLNLYEPTQIPHTHVPPLDEEHACEKEKNLNVDNASSGDEIDSDLKDPTYFCESKNVNLKRKSVVDLKDDVNSKQGKLSSAERKQIVQENDIHDQMLINDVKNALSKTNSRQEKYKLLTTLPSHWSVRKIHKELNVSRRMASNAKKLRMASGYGASSNQKCGRPVSNNIVDEVESFYTSDQWSRLMPGRKDYVTIVKNGVREQVQKRLLLGNIKTLHEKFTVKNPQLKISLSAFTKLRPRSCIPVGTKGTHNVCVCHIHQNMKLKFIGINDAFDEIGAESDYSVREVRELMVCDTATSTCFLLECKNCPGVKHIVNNFAELFSCHGIKEVNYSSWKKTDR